MKNLIKIFVVSIALCAIFAACNKENVPQTTIIHPQIFAGYATLANGVNIPISSATPRPLDSSSVGRNFKSAINVEINNTDTVTTSDFVWYTLKSNSIVVLDSLHFMGDITHVTPTVVLPARAGVTNVIENNLSINQYYGAISIPVGTHVPAKGSYYFQGYLRTAKGGLTILPVLYVQIN